MTTPKPVLLLILDGWGASQNLEGNAIHAAQTPNWDRLQAEFPYSELEGCGEVVGLPSGQIGNSEVGHLTMGAGRIVPQDLTKIDQAIKDESFFQNSVLQEAFQKAQQKQSAVHIMGLCSSGGVHSHQAYIFACLNLLKHYDVPVFVHAFLDGRDVAPKCAESSLQALETECEKYSSAKLATVCGRFYAMDRDQRWDRIQKAYNAITQNAAEYTAQSGVQALKAAYERGETDEFVSPTLTLSDAYPGLNKNDQVVFMNFRADRARQLCFSLTAEDFKGFKQTQSIPSTDLYTLTEFDTALNANVIYPKEQPRNVLGQILESAGMTQLRIAETEKYAHVTFFFNGGREAPFNGEDRVLIPSPKVKTYDLKPEMSAKELTHALIEAVHSKQYDVIICNYANADMVGHTGDFSATIEAIECLDKCLSEICQTLTSVGGEALITADHGNADCMFEPGTQNPHTAHTLSRVPLIYFGQQPLAFKKHAGSLQDVAPTLLKILGKTAPKEMSGESLLTDK